MAGKEIKRVSNEPEGSTCQKKKKKKKTLTRPQIPIRPPSLHLRHIRLSQTQLRINPNNVLPHRQTRHAVRVVRDPAERVAFACCEGLPPGFGAAFAGVDCVGSYELGG